MEAALEVAALAVATCGGMGGSVGVFWTLQIRCMNGWAVGGFPGELGGWPVTWHASNLASCILQGIQQRSGGYGGALVEPLFVFPSCWQSKSLECEGAFKVSTARVLPGSAFKLQASHKVTPARVVRGH